jgi:glycosyltransferase involved in cell wall biosynthesis
MILFSIVIPCHPPYLRFLEDLIKNINSFDISEGYQIKEIILSASEISEVSEVPEFTNLISLSKYPIFFDLTTDKCNAAKNRNRGWKKVTGEWIIFIDADDYYYLDKLLITYNVITENPDIDCMLHSYHFRRRINTHERCASFNTSKADYLYDATFPDGNFENVDKNKVNVEAPFAVAHGIISCRASSTFRFEEHRDVGEDGNFCRKHTFNKKLVAIDAVLMDYRPQGGAPW